MRGFSTKDKKTAGGSFAYDGNELDIFAAAHNWKLYWSSQIRHFIGRNVAEVGAGIGGSTAYICDGSQERWVCVEPDPYLASLLHSKVAEKQLPSIVTVRNSTLSRLPSTETFDTILYIDVLEHIEDDTAEAQQATEHLAAGGRLIVVAPAYPALFTAFDRAIGHYRRYTSGSLKLLAPDTLKPLRCHYLDSAGLIASLGNKLLLHATVPTQDQIRLWDQFLVPTSRILDRLFLHAIGKSILGVWERK